MGGSVENVAEALVKSYNLVKDNFRLLSVKFLKIHLLTYLILIVEFAFLAILLGLVIGKSLLDFGNPEYFSNAVSSLVGNILIFAAGALIIMLVFRMICSSVDAVAYILVERKGRASILGEAKNLLAPIFKYTIVILLLEIVVFAVPCIIAVQMLLSAGDIMAKISIITLVFLAFFIIWLLVMFFIQFALLEIVLGRSGTLESVSSSIKLVRSNWTSVLAFDIALFVILFTASFIFGIAIEVVELLFYIGIVNPGFCVLPIILIIALMLAQGIAISLISVPSQYHFWRIMKDGSE